MMELDASKPDASIIYQLTDATVKLQPSGAVQFLLLAEYREMEPDAANF
jgi:hypothetical protein